MTFMRSFATLLLLLAQFACFAERASDTGFSVVDSAGTLIVTSRSAQWKSGEGWKLDSIPIAVIGDDEGNPKEQFRYVPKAKRLSDGRILVHDDDDGNELRLFSADGKFIKVVAPSGMGPGEFRYVSLAVPYPGDTIVVRGDDKVAKFSPDGRLVSETRLTTCDTPRFWQSHLWCSIEVFPDGSGITMWSDSTIPLSETNRESVLLKNGMHSPGPGLLRRLRRIYIIPPARDTAYSAGIDIGLEQYGIDAASGNTVFIRHPFHARSLRAAGGTPLRFAMAMNPDYNFQIWSREGQLERIIRRERARRVPNDAEKKDAVEDLRRRYAQRISMDRILAEVPVPDSLSAVQGLVVSASGELLVQREGWLPSHVTSLFDVFDKDGRFLGELRFPRRARIDEVGSDYLMLTRLNDDDVPLVEVYRLRR